MSEYRGHPLYQNLPNSHREQAKRTGVAVADAFVDGRLGNRALALIAVGSLTLSIACLLIGAWQMGLL